DLCVQQLATRMFSLEVAGVRRERAALTGVATQAPDNTASAVRSDTASEAPIAPKTPVSVAAMAPGILPSVGSVWNYSFRDRIFGNGAREFSVRAGRFEAFRVKFVGENENALFATSSAHAVNAAANDYVTQRFEYTVWYAPQIGRYVQANHKAFNKYGKEVGDEWIRLTGFRQ